MERGLIVKPRNPGNHRPKFQAQFGVAEEEPDGPREGLVQGFGQCRCHQYPTATASRCGVFLKQEKPPRFQGLLAMTCI